MANTIFNPGDNNFRNILNNRYYVDKTDLIFELNKIINTLDKYICVSMPKYFGKSTISDMLTAYYSYRKDKTTIFNDKKIGKIYENNKTENTNNYLSMFNLFKSTVKHYFSFYSSINYKYLNEFNVIKLNMIKIFKGKNSIKEGIEKIKKEIIYEVKITIQNFKFNDEDDITKIFYDIYRVTNRQIIFIIDEWDYVLRYYKNDKEFIDSYLDFFDTFLEDEDYLALAFITGILPIKQYKMNLFFEKFNVFSMISPRWMTKYIGITDNEVKEIFENILYNEKLIFENSQNLIINKRRKLNDKSFKRINEEKIEQEEEEEEESKKEINTKNVITYEDIKEFYNGYQLINSISNEKYEIYSPYSIINAIENNEIKNYQMLNTSIQNEFYEIIKINFKRIKDVINLLMKNEKVNIDSLIYQNDMITFKKRKEQLILLVHLGYLSFNSKTNEIFIPNKEILELFESAIQSEIFESLSGLEMKIFNPGEKEYLENIKKSTIYIDKTELINNLNKVINTKDKIVCNSRPRRFGKTFTATMLSAYYSFTESKINSFDDQKISKIENWNKYLGNFNVIKLNMMEYFIKTKLNEGIEIIKNSIITEVQKSGIDFEYNDNINIKRILEEIYIKTHRKIVIIIDEWDFVLRYYKNDKESIDSYLVFFDTFLKDEDYLALAFITGILPIKQYKMNLNFDKFNEFSMTSPRWMAKYIGFTDNEVKEMFENILYNEKLIFENSQNLIINKRIKLNDKSFKRISDEKIEQEKEKKEEDDGEEKKKELSTKNVIIYESIKEFYNGYQLVNNNEKYEIYSPYSIINAIENNEIKNYQMLNTSIQNEFYEIIKINFKRIKDVINLLMKNEKVNIDSLIYQNDMITFKKRKEQLILLVHLGYLSFNSKTNEIFIPNKEILELFESAIQSEIFESLSGLEMKIFNPGEKEYLENIKKSTIYIDKTELINNLNKVINTTDKIVCISRPRRFGKTFTATMLSAYYSFTESKIISFDDQKITKIENWNKYLGKFNVIKLNMMEYFIKNKLNEGIEIIKNSIITEVQKSGIDFKYNNTINIKRILEEINIKTHRNIVIIIDEWDFILRRYKDNKEIHREYLEFLNLMIKDVHCLALVYMTGILPFKRNDIDSSFGYVNEFSMTSPKWMAKYIGFTDNEVKEICEKLLTKKNEIENSNNEMNENGILIKSLNNENQKKINENMINHELEYKKKIKISYENIKYWYNGYKLYDETTGTKYNIYSPISILGAINRKKIENYWCKSGTVELLQKYINYQFPKSYLQGDIGLLIKRNKIKIDILTFKNDMTSFEKKDDILTMFIHLGYLSYDENTKEVFIPNNEILEEFKVSTKNDQWNNLINKLDKSKILLQETLNKNEQLVAKLLKEASKDNVNNKLYNNKDMLSYAIQLSYYYTNTKYKILRRFNSGKGYTDIFFIPYNPNEAAIVVELRHEKSLETGIDQIKERKYPKTLEYYKNNLLLVSFNYNIDAKSNCLKFKDDSCKIEKYKEKNIF